MLDNILAASDQDCELEDSDKEDDDVIVEPK